MKRKRITSGVHRTGGEDGRFVSGMSDLQTYNDEIQIGMFMFIVSNLAGSSIQITTLPLPVLSTLQAVCPRLVPVLRAHAYVDSLDWCSIRYARL